MNPFNNAHPTERGLLDQFLEMKKQKLREHLRAFTVLGERSMSGNTLHHPSNDQELPKHSRRRSFNTIRFLQKLQQDRERKIPDLPIQHHFMTNYLPIPIPIRYSRVQDLTEVQRPATTTIIAKKQQSEQKFDEIVQSISDILTQSNDRSFTYRKKTKDACTMTSGATLAEEEVKAILSKKQKQAQRNKFIQTDFVPETVVEKEVLVSTPPAPSQPISTQTETEEVSSEEEIIDKEIPEGDLVTDLEEASVGDLETSPEDNEEEKAVNDPEEILEEQQQIVEMKKEFTFAEDEKQRHIGENVSVPPVREVKKQYHPPRLVPDTPKYYFQGKKEMEKPSLIRQPSDQLPEFFTRLGLQSPAESAIRTRQTPQISSPISAKEPDTKPAASQFDMVRRNSKMELLKQSSQIELDLAKMEKESSDKKNRRASFSEVLTTHERAKTAPVGQPKSILKKRMEESKPGTASSNSSAGSGYAKKFAKKRNFHIDPTLFRHFNDSRATETDDEEMEAPKARPRTTQGSRSRSETQRIPPNPQKAKKATTPYSNQVDFSHYQGFGESLPIQTYQNPPNYGYGYYEQQYYDPYWYGGYDYAPQAANENYSYDPYSYYAPQTTKAMKSTKSSMVKKQPSSTTMKSTKPSRLPPIQQKPSSIRNNDSKNSRDVGPIRLHAKDVVSNNPKGALRQLYENQPAGRKYGKGNQWDPNQSHLDSIYNYYY
jgi:hypothetical protein